MSQNNFDVTKEDFIKLLNLDKEHPFNEEFGVKFISDEPIKHKYHKYFRRLSFMDVKTNRLYYVKYIVFDNEGKPDLDINNEFYCKVFKA